MYKNVKGHILIVMAPTASGKGTLIKQALKTFPELSVAVSCTTRKMRPGETNGLEYHFLSPTEFEQKKQAGEFLEWAYFGVNQYGTLKNEIIPRLEEGGIVIVEIDVQGVKRLRTLIPVEHMTIVFIDAGGWDVLKARALKRAPMSEEEILSRYERYLIEVKAKDIADIIIDNSGTDFTSAKNDFCQLIIDIKNRVYTV